MELTKILNAKKLPGIVEVASLLSAIAVLFLNKPEKDLTLWDAALVLLLALMLYSWGTILDPILFDPLYGLTPSSRLKRAWHFVAGVMFFPIKFIVDRLPVTHEMAKSREEATEKLRTQISGKDFKCETDEDCKGIYSDAKSLLEGSAAWDESVEPWLKLSKAIRSFVWPLAAILAYDFAHRHVRLIDRLLSLRVLNLLAQWRVSLAALVLALVLYVWLRVLHMEAMYKLVEQSEYVPFQLEPNAQSELRMAIPVRRLRIGQYPPKVKQPMFLLLGKREYSAKACHSA